MCAQPRSRWGIRPERQPPPDAPPGTSLLNLSVPRKQHTASLSSIDSATKERGAELNASEHRCRLRPCLPVLPMWARDKPRTFSIVVAIMCTIVAVGIWQFYVEEVDADEERRASVQGIANKFADDVRRNVLLSVGSTYATGAVVKAFGNNFTFAHFQEIVQNAILPTYPGITTMQYAPNAVIEGFHPQYEQDLPAIGLDLLVFDERREAALATIKGYPEQRALLSGPLRIIQGGVAVIARHPVFTADAPKFTPAEPYVDLTGKTHEVDCSTEALAYKNCFFPGPDDADGNPAHFWGMTNMLSYIETFLEPAELGRLESGNVSAGDFESFEYQLRAVTPHVTLEDVQGIFARSASAPEAELMEDAVRAEVRVDEFGVHWELLVRPRGGWLGTSSTFALNLVLVAVFTVVGGAGMGGVIIINMRAAYRRREAFEQAGAQAALAAHEAAAAAHARSRLIRKVMHGVRSPMMSIGVIAASLDDGAGPESTATIAESHPMIRALIDCSARVEAIVSDMLDFERIEAGHLTLVYAPFRPAELLRATWLSVEARARDKGLRCPEPDLAPEVDESLVLVGDAKRLAQCIASALSNALRFTDAGGEIRLAARLGGASGGGAARPVLVVVVEDTGCGMTDSELEHVTSEATEAVFKEVSRGQMQNHGGAGMGLFIARRILLAHERSTLRVFSEGAGKGTRVELRLRCQRAEQGQEAAPFNLVSVTNSRAPTVRAPSSHRTASLTLASSADPGGAAGETGGVGQAAVGPSGPDAGLAEESDGAVAAFRQRVSAGILHGPAAAAAAAAASLRVLHAEDDPFLRLSLPPQTFHRLGLDFSQADNGHEALDRVAQGAAKGEPFGVVVIDNQMPVVSGTEAVARLRADGFTGLIIGMTGEAPGSLERNAFEAAGLDACVEKDGTGLEELTEILRVYKAAWEERRSRGLSGASEDSGARAVGAGAGAGGGGGGGVGVRANGGVGSESLEVLDTVDGSHTDDGHDR